MRSRKKVPRQTIHSEILPRYNRVLILRLYSDFDISVKWVQRMAVSFDGLLLLTLPSSTVLIGILKFWIVSTLFWVTFPASIAVAYVTIGSVRTMQLFKALVHDFLQTLFIILVVISGIIYLGYQFIAGLFWLLPDASMRCLSWCMSIPLFLSEVFIWIKFKTYNYSVC